MGYRVGRNNEKICKHRDYYYRLKLFGLLQLLICDNFSLLVENFIILPSNVPFLSCQCGQLNFPKTFIQFIHFPCLWRPLFLNESMQVSKKPWSLPGLHHSGGSGGRWTTAPGQSRGCPWPASEATKGIWEN